MNVSYQNFSTKYSNSLAIQKQLSPTRNFISKISKESDSIPGQYHSQILPNSKSAYQDPIEKTKTQKELNR